MLIVVTIMLIITVAVVAVAPRFTDDRKLTRAADQIAQTFLTAKQRALRDQIPTGVRLLIDQQRSNLKAYPPIILVTEMQYIQQPDDFKGPDVSGAGITVGPITISGVNNGFPVLAAVGYGVDFTGGFNDQSLWSVQPGDNLEVKGNGLIHLITNVVIYVDPNRVPHSTLLLAPAAPNQGGTILNANTIQVMTANQLAVGMFVNGPNIPPNTAQITGINNTPPNPTITVGGASLTPGSIPPPLLSFIPQYTTSLTREYRIIRQPRVLTGETPLQLPAGICIDPGAKYSGDPYAITTAPFDIMFSPQGGVLNSGGRDATILWVRDYTKDVSYPATTWPPPGQPGDQFLILIQTHTGFIAEHPVNLNPGGDPYLFTRDARSSGM
jgi:type II secretory pathway pseudopilin PulG